MEEKITITTSQIQRELSILGGRILIVLFPISIYSIVQLVRFGNQGDYLLLFVGSILSFIATMGYIIAELKYGVKKQKSFIAMLLAFGGFIPYLFGCYLVFIDGFWSLKELVNGFSIFITIKAILFLLLGYVIVSKFYQITKLCQDVSKDGVVIMDEQQNN